MASPAVTDSIPKSFEATASGFWLRIIWWIGFTVVLALAPLIVAANSFSHGGWGKAIHHGELILIAVAIAGTGIGTAFQTAQTPSLKSLVTLVFVVGIIFLVVATLFYADTHDAVAQQEVRTQDFARKHPSKLVPQNAVIGSPTIGEVDARSHILFGLAVVVGFTSIVASYLNDKRRGLVK